MCAIALVAAAGSPAQAEVSNSAGVGDRSIEEFPNGHPAFVSDADTVAVPSNPVPGRSLERIEAGSRTDKAVAGTVGSQLGGYLARRYAYPALAQMGGPIPVIIAVVATMACWVKVHPESEPEDAAP
jgi:hypothetical protein